ncbi:hypothetical protein BH24BAC1_BH24BAC1_26110 [soil metagenome]
MVCADHEQTGLGKAMAQQVSKLEREVRSLVNATNPEGRAGAAKRFRQRVERGDFALLFADRMEALLTDDKRGFEDEQGALRVAMMRLLLEENDPAKLAMALSAVTNAQVRAARAQEQLGSVPRSREALQASVTKVEAATRRLTPEEAREEERRQHAREMGWTAEQMHAWYDPVHQRRVLEKELARRRRVMEEVGPGWQAAVDDPYRIAADGAWGWRDGAWGWREGETVGRIDGETVRNEAGSRAVGEPGRREVGGRFSSTRVAQHDHHYFEEPPSQPSPVRVAPHEQRGDEKSPSRPSSVRVAQHEQLGDEEPPSRPSPARVAQHEHRGDEEPLSRPSPVRVAQHEHCGDEKPPSQPSPVRGGRSHVAAMTAPRCWERGVGRAEEAAVGEGDDAGAWSRLVELRGLPETWELPDLRELDGEELRETMERLTWGAPGAYQEAMRRASEAERRGM